MYFTTIANLRASSAMQDRVTKVANNLKKMRPDWGDNTLFPIAAVGLSNSQDDMDWVFYHSDVHVSNTTKKVLIANGYECTASHLNKALETAGVQTVDKLSGTKINWVSANLEHINSAVTQLIGSAFFWSNGIKFVSDLKTGAPVAAKAKVIVVPHIKVKLPDNVKGYTENVRYVLELISQLTNAEIGQLVAGVPDVVSAADRAQYFPEVATA